MVKRDYYDVLEISPDADEKEIKRAYRKLAKKYHPDTNQGDKYAEQKFKEITEAYNVLSDSEKKKLYDQFGFAAFDGSMENGGSQKGSSGDGWSFDFGNNGSYKEYHFEGGNMDDMFGGIFDDIFHNDFHRDYKHGFGQKKGYDIESDITISFDEAVFGCDKMIRFDGNQNQPLKVHIPAGIDEGQRVRLKGKGHPGMGNASAGDLFLKVHIREKKGMERKGMDVYTTEKIPYTTAVLGGEVVFHTLYGTVQCKIAAGTQSGSKIRLRNKGIVSMKNPAVHGDAYVTIQIEVPKTVTAEERRKLEELERIRQSA